MSLELPPAIQEQLAKNRAVNFLPKPLTVHVIEMQHNRYAKRELQDDWESAIRWCGEQLDRAEVIS